MHSIEKSVLSFNEEDITRTLTIVKKRIPSRTLIIKDEMARDYLNLVNQLSYFYKFFETRIAIKKGDVFLVRFSFECGNELSGDHFVVALLDSSPLNPMVTVIPLKSDKGRPLNPASDVFIGKINGMNSEKESVAIINQIRTIDKRRMFKSETVKHLDKYLVDQTISDYEEIKAENKRIFRLTSQQYAKIHRAICEYVYNGFINHD